MIVAVTLRLLYLIFQQVLGLVLLTGRAAHPRTSSCSCCGMRLLSSAAATRDPA